MKTINRKEKTLMNELKITIPEGFEIDKETSTFELIKFKKIESKFPKRWDDLKEIKGYYLDRDSGLRDVKQNSATKDLKNVFPTKKYAEASLALAQLLQLRQVYNEGWEPDFADGTYKHCICVDSGMLVFEYLVKSQRVMSFKLDKIRDLFFENFKDLLEIAKPLL